MLILTRRLTESIWIDTDIKVTVLGIKGNQVRIGIEAPTSVAVDREEIYERKRRGLTEPAPVAMPAPLKPL